MRPMYFDREGRPLTPEQWAVLFEDMDYRRVAVTDTPGGAGLRVSTVWLGLDHGFGDGPPVIFETMVFGGGMDVDQDRYSTLAEAKAGHAAMVEKWSWQAEGQP